MAIYEVIVKRLEPQLVAHREKLDGHNIPAWLLEPLVQFKLLGDPTDEYTQGLTLRNSASLAGLRLEGQQVLHEGDLPDLDAVRKVVDPVPDARVMADLDAIVAWAKKQPSALADRIGMTGFCRGGLYALLFAAHSADVKAAVAWYGQIKPAKTEGIRTVGPLDVVARVKAPVLGLYGEADQGIPVADVKELEAAFKAAGKTAEFTVKVSKIEWPHMPELNADFIKSIGIASGEVSALRDEIRENLVRESDARIKSTNKDKVMDALAKMADYWQEQPLPFYPWLRQLAWERLAKLHERHVQAQKRAATREAVGS